MAWYDPSARATARENRRGGGLGFYGAAILTRYQNRLLTPKLQGRRWPGIWPLTQAVEEVHLPIGSSPFVQLLA